MIISHKYNFIFLKTRKTAGTSFEIALSKYMDEKDIITPISPEDEKIRQLMGFRGPQNYLHPVSMGFKAVGLNLFENRNFKNHNSAKEVRKRIGNKKFDSFFKISIIRDPYDLAISRFYWDQRLHTGSEKQSFESWLRSRPDSLLSNKRITTINNKNVVDFMIRFENFNDDIIEFAKRVGISQDLAVVFNNIQAKVNFRPKGTDKYKMFSEFPEGIDIIKSIFKDEIETYGYELKNNF